MLTSIIAIGTNLASSEWGSVFPEPRLVAAIVDRVTFNAQILETGTQSCRLAPRARRPSRDPGGDCQEALALGGHQEQLVQALLTLATSERGVTCRDTLDLAHAFTGVLASRHDQAAEAAIDLARHLMPAVTAGDLGLIESLIANLVDNAIRHNHPDGHVEVTTQTSGTHATLTVTNSGPVVPGDQIQPRNAALERLIYFSVRKRASPR